MKSYSFTKDYVISSLKFEWDFICDALGKLNLFERGPAGFFGFSLRNFSLRTSFTFAAWNAGNEMKKITEMLAESWHRQCALHKTTISHICKRKVVFVRKAGDNLPGCGRSISTALF